MAAVQAYTADGRRFCSYSLETIERLLRLKKLLVQRNRKGAIVAAYFRQPDGASPVRKSPHLGSTYSFYKRVGQTHVWQHKRLISPSELTRVDGTLSEKQVERSLMEAFLGVPLSVLVSSHEQNPQVRSALFPVMAKLQQTPNILPDRKHAYPSTQGPGCDTFLCAKELAALLGVSERVAGSIISSSGTETIHVQSSLWPAQNRPDSRSERGWDAGGVHQRRKSGRKRVRS